MAEKTNMQGSTMNKMRAAQVESTKLVPSTFADQILNSHTPVDSARKRPLEEVVGNIFKLISSKTETVNEQDKGGKVHQIPRSVYEVQCVNGPLISDSQTLTVKIKGEESILTEEQHLKLKFNEGVIIVTFEELNHWVFSGNEGLSASGVHLKEVTSQQFKQLVQGLRHV
ncbi:MULTISPECIES: hypothetical protein [Lactobacillus]|uniref:hypothetical protein n=1 Tax=Lactobacillus TaxID=1578 RepID=UPI000B5DB4A5|nr:MULTISPECIES: hypothetical protein [Lactobacillus]UNL59417.1 hypothetical protein G8B18_01290 [Lactobacillus johnsonii]